ncbi:heavy metal-associated domain-containing protein [Nocardioides sp.]|uniref:heavy metal-associated domain-containing protein n=1 Tax=Nocardioides sp. TaxID=35761 RepID=UPI002BD05B1E|nr:heavy metal-associated domain-containing protein [Nocardioides sp.]HXH78746.1 heavy metal-associated domain-containing protein [Nocardioides sp.]
MPATTRLTFAIEGMHCASCTLLIDEVLEDLEGVHRSTTKLRKRQTVVDVDPTACTPEGIVLAIAEAGYTASWQT